MDRIEVKPGSQLIVCNTDKIITIKNSLTVLARVSALGNYFFRLQGTDYMVRKECVNVL